MSSKLLDAEQIKSNAGPNNVDDRVHRADLMKVDVLDVDTVDLRLRFRKSSENRRCPLLHGIGQARAGDKCFNISKMAMRMFMGHFNVCKRRGDSRTIYCRKLDFESLKLELQDFVK